jgi:hypothetical protein
MKPIVSSALSGVFFPGLLSLSFFFPHSLCLVFFLYLFIYLALDPTFGSFTLLELVSHYMNWFFW